MARKGIVTRIGEALDQWHSEEVVAPESQSVHPGSKSQRWLRRLLPTPGNVLFTLLVIGSLLWAQNVGAVSLVAPTVNSALTIPYQGRLANASGTPFTGNQNMEFRLYNAPSGGTPLWSELWTGGNSVTVNDGLFSVLLGSLQSGLPGVVQGNSQLWLGITVGTDGEMSPRVQLGSAAYSMQALTVPDGSINSTKIQDGSINNADIANGAVSMAKLGSDVSFTPSDGSITTAKLADGAVTKAKLNLLADSDLLNTKGRLLVNGGELVFADAGGTIYRDNWIGMANNLEGTKPWLHIGGITDNADNLRRAAIYADKTYLSGKVGIGTVTPSESLDVNGNMHLQGKLNNGYPLPGQRGDRRVYWGNIVVTAVNGVARVNYEQPFTNGTEVVVATNGDANAGTFTINTFSHDKNGFSVKLVSEGGALRNGSSRIHYMAVGD